LGVPSVLVLVGTSGILILVDVPGVLILVGVPDILIPVDVHGVLILVGASGGKRDLLRLPAGLPGHH
jgi:hypothetical protein